MQVAADVPIGGRRTTVDRIINLFFPADGDVGGYHLRAMTFVNLGHPYSVLISWWLNN